MLLWFLICAATGPFAQSKDHLGIADSIKTAPITDSELLGWAGKWQGHCHVGTDSLPIEVKWKLTDDGKWLRGEFRIWNNFKKAALVHNEIIFIRPDNTEGIYKGVAIGENGNCRMGRAQIKDRTWEWTWNYDNGNQEKGKLVFYDQGEITYDATVMDAEGKEMNILDYDITRPIVLIQK